MASEGLLKLFLPQELSMAVWAMATLIGRRQPGRGGHCAEVDMFGLAVAEEVLPRIHEFSPQGLANIAWAFATLDLSQHEATGNFLIAAATVASSAMSSFSPQAISNLLWALGKSNGLHEADEVVTFGKAAAVESQRRTNDFTWQDLAGVVSALTNLGLSDEPEIRSFAVALVNRTSKCCPKIGTQALLNIAQSAVRMRMEPELLKPLAVEMAKVLDKRNLNQIDERQWEEVKRCVNFTSHEFKLVQTPFGQRALKAHTGRINWPGAKNAKGQAKGNHFQGLSPGMQ
eukprot:TRINITY_DN10217_c0_g1_i1.p1 TRINITY_DN10217_c0_g1~~TRINITY_DN10217_c0_g1_i1.p1  ORF type:complete len:323 (-),score=71.97 TRINITY_DN10217_c0_g1_i1:45-905(-)